MPRALFLALIFAAPVLAEPKFDPHGDPLPDGAICRFGTVRDVVGRAYHPADPDPRRSYALSPDGKTLACEYPEGVNFWDVDTGKITRRLTCREAVCDYPPRFALAYSPDGKFLARVGGRVVTLWDLATGKHVFEFDYRREGPFEEIAFLPGGEQLVVTTSVEDRMHTLDARTGKVLHSVQLEDQYVLEPAGPFVAGRSKEAWVLYDPATLKELVRFPTKDDKSEVLRADPDGKRVWVATLTGRLRAVDTRTGKTLQELAAPTGWKDGLPQLAFSPDGTLIYMRAFGGTERYDLRAGKWLAPLADVQRVTIIPHPDGKRILALAYDGVLHRFDASTGKRLPGADGFAGDLHAFPSPDGRRVVIESGAGETGNRLDLFELTGRHIWTVHPSRNEQGTPRWAADGRTLLCDGRKTIVLRDADTGRVTRTLAIPTPEKRMLHTVLFPPGGNRLMLHLSDGLVALDLTKESLPERVSLKASGKIALSPDGRTVVSDEMTEGIQLFDLATGKTMARVPAPKFLDRRQRDTAAGFLFSPDGSYVLSWDREMVRAPLKAQRSFAILRDPTTLAVRRQFETDRGEIGLFDSEGLAVFSPDGLWFAVGSDSGSWALWDVPTGTRLARFEGHRDKITSIGFAGRARVATGSQDLTALVWDLKPDEKPTGPLWEAISGDNAREAYRATWALAADPKTPELLRAKVSVPTVSAEKVKQWIADLAADQFAVREAATKELQDLGRPAEPELRSARERVDSEEVRTRIDGLLAKIPRERSGIEIVQARAVAALELAGTAEAKKLLGEWGAGAPGARLTIDAKAALARLDARGR